jgi:outer membrane protein, multidrug efflux system
MLYSLHSQLNSLKPSFAHLSISASVHRSQPIQLNGLGGRMILALTAQAPTPTRWFAVWLSGTVVAITLAGCASTASIKLPSAQTTQTDSQVQAPAAWQAALPHGGSTATMANWWAQWRDAALVELVDAAQKESATLSSAKSRIAQARAALTGAQSALLPGVSANAQASRSVQTPGAPQASALSAGVQASWEIDVYGGNRAASIAAQARLDGAELGWHEARVAVAAETAAIYYSLRYCESSAVLAQNDAASRAETARLTELTAKAGFNAPANAALARASAAEGANTVRAAQAQCHVLIKSLVALSGIDEPTLRKKLKANQVVAQQINAGEALFNIATLPANVLQQRPDIVAAQRAVAAASLDARAFDAKRYPVLSLSGNIGVAVVRQAGFTNDGLTWSLGPIALTVPLLDGGRAAANTQAAVAAYDDAVVALRAKVRNAVREVEEALVNLDSAAQRNGDALQAAAGYKAALDAAQARYKAGLGSLVELEDARRTSVFAQQSLLGLERDRIAAWISLYRAAGGGWTAQSPATASAPTAR